MFKFKFKTRINKVEKQIQEEEKKPKEKVMHLGGTQIVDTT